MTRTTGPAPLRHPRHRAVGAGAVLALTAGAAFLLLPGATATAAEPIANGGFETGDLTGWSCTGDSHADSGAPHSGGYALVSAPTGQNIAPCAQTVQVRPGASYVLRAWVKGGYVRLSATGTGVDASNWTASTDWTQLTTPFTAGPGTTQVTVTVSGWYGTGAIGADDVSLAETAPGTASPTASPTPSPTASPTTVPTTPPPTTTAPPTTTPPPTTAPATTPPPGSGDTVRVTNGKELKAALASAVPGRTIQLADGTYSGNFDATVSGTADRRITLVGSPAAVLVPPTGGGYVLHLDHASYWTVQGMTLTGGQKGIVVDSSDHVVIDSVTVHHLTMEGVHFRSSSSYGILRNSTIHDTGTAGDGKGEGVYVGTANTLTDRSDHVQILDNVIGPRIGGENIDLKEGTSAGLVSGNTFYGDGLTGRNYDDSWVDVKGNDYVVEHNTGTTTTKDGYQTHSQQPGWGCRTVFRGNDSDLTGATGSERYAFDITNYDPASCPVTITTDNTVTGGDGLANPGIPIG